MYERMEIERNGNLFYVTRKPSSLRFKGGKGGGGYVQPKPVPPAVVSVPAPLDKSSYKKRRGYSSTILATGLGMDNELKKILRTDKLG